MSERWLVKGTDKHTGYKEFVNADNNDLKYLSYGRLILRDEVKSYNLSSADKEIALIFVGGGAKVLTNGKEYIFGKHDAIYLPHHTEAEVITDDAADILVCMAPSDKDVPVQPVYYNDIKDDFNPCGKVETSTRRDIWTLIGPNVQASRLLIGFTHGLPGHWTSWPPHEHGDTREEVYVYYDMPEPGFGIQFVYNDPHNMEFTRCVRSGDAVVIPYGYHQNVAAPGTQMKFVWIMAGIKPDIDREWADVHVQPGYEHIKL